MSESNTDPIGAFMPNSESKSADETAAAKKKTDSAAVKDDFREWLDGERKKAGLVDDPNRDYAKEAEGFDEWFAGVKRSHGMGEQLNPDPLPNRDNPLSDVTRRALLNDLRRGNRINLSAHQIIDVDLSGMDLRKAELRGATFINCKFKGAILPGDGYSGSVLALAGVNFEGCDFRGVMVDLAPAGHLPQEGRISEWTEVKQLAATSTQSKFVNCTLPMTREERLTAEWKESMAKKEAKKVEDDARQAEEDRMESQARAEELMQEQERERERQRRRPGFGRLRNL